MTTTNFKKLLLATGTTVSLLSIGCGDDNGPGATPDAPPVVEPFVERPIDANGQDGGEVRIENLIFPDGISRTLNTSYFINAQTGKMPFPNINGCNTLADKIYPFGDASDTIGAPATWAPGGRVYMDVGADMTLQAPGKEAFKLKRYEDFITPFLGGSYHDITYNVQPGPDPFMVVDAELMGTDGQNVGGTKLKVTLPGGADLDRPVVWDFENGFSGIEIPPRPVVTGFSRLGVPSALDLSRSADFNPTWEVPAGSPPDLLSFVAVFRTSPDVALTHLCVFTTPGDVTVPAATMATLPDTGILFVAHLLHRYRTLDNVRRVDMVGTACTSTGFTMVP